jgi:eukaryotic-like serine/threonine-protein kinase
LTWISDSAVTRLREITDNPDTSGTRYRIVRTIGRGGMGVVCEAEDLVLERRVALKVLATEIASAGTAERLRDEAITMARLEHPGIAPVYDAGTLADGRVFYAMKLVRGRQLNHLHLSAAELLRIFLRICETVAFAHANGVIHCDLKPENVMTGEFGEVLVMDWGVARAIGDRAVAGTRDFMSPEQARGEAVDASTDVFALGAILRTLIANPTKALRAVVAKATAAEKDERYADARALAEEIGRYLDGEPLRAYRPSVVERTSRWVARNSALLGVMAAYVIMRLVVFLWLRR